MIYYLIFCLATSVSACLTILYPAMCVTRQVNSDSIMLKNSFITYLIMCVLMTLAAPILFPFMWDKKSSTSLINGIARSFVE